MFTLDKQLPKLPKEVKFCKDCVVSNQRPRTEFNAKGICSACEWAYEKDYIDWDKREKELQDLCNKYRSNNGSFDVVVPGSGGKDSGFVAYQLKHKYRMHPLCVTWMPFEFTNIGWQNLQSFIHSGFNNILGQPNQQIHRKLARISFELVGDPFLPFIYGQKFWACHIARAFKIPFIMYGENGEVEYGGSTKGKDEGKQDIKSFTENFFKGVTVDDLVKAGLDCGIFGKDELEPKELELYKLPTMDGIEMYWYSYYHKWMPQVNLYFATVKNGFKANLKRSEGTYTNYASLDDKLDGLHWYLGYMKFGLGRASRDAQSDIRCHQLVRDKAVRLVRQYDHEFPKEHFLWALNYLKITEEFFWKVCNFYRESSNVWKKDNGKWILKHIVSSFERMER